MADISLRILDLVVEETLRRIEELAGDAVDFHVAYVLVRVVAALVDVLEPAVSGDLLGIIEPGASVGDQSDAGNHLVFFDH